MGQNPVELELLIVKRIGKSPLLESVGASFSDGSQDSDYVKELDEIDRQTLLTCMEKILIQDKRDPNGVVKYEKVYGGARSIHESGKEGTIIGMVYKRC